MKKLILLCSIFLSGCTFMADNGTVYVNRAFFTYKQGIKYALEQEGYENVQVEKTYDGYRAYSNGVQVWKTTNERPRGFLDFSDE